MFKNVPNQFDFPAMERDILAFWEANSIYEKSLDQRKGGKPFVFFEGPPTANGLPHPGHCLTRAIKDLFPRFKTMTGHYVLRKGGWDTHGLPVEVEVCKELGIHSKEEIEAYGVEPFNRKCLESVFRYTKQWEDLTRRLGFWVNLDEAYVTYHQSYIESVWWSLKQLFDAGLLYQGYKIVWWWAQGGTALSSGEVGQGYREVDDPSVYVRFPLVEDERFHKLFSREALPSAAKSSTSLLIWTTTPWTLPSNTFAAVHKDFDYALVHDDETGDRLIFATSLVEPIAKKAKKKSWKIERTLKGEELLGLSYRPPFDWYRKSPAKNHVPHAEPGIPLGDYKPALAAGGADFACWRILHADFVTLDSGTGLVHEAPAFGEVDFNLLQDQRKQFKRPEDIPLLCAVAPNGTFTDEAPAYKGRWVKDCDKDIIRDLKERGLLLHQEQYRHDYPFCWRAEEDPLIQYPRKSWFIRTTQFKDAMLENNQHINWLPEHIKDGRFGNFLKDNVDWSLSRERYWGTPLPIWVCQNEKCGHMVAVDSYESLMSKPGVAGLEVWENAKKQEATLSEHLKVHKPYIDAITFECPKCTDQSRDRKGAVPFQTDRPSHSRETPSLTVGAPIAGRMKRVTEVIDCWYDSGAMPFAQWGYPHQNREMFQSQFPADFISEALDQTRGWFYSLVAISTMLFSEASLKHHLQHSIQTAQKIGWLKHRIDGLRALAETANTRVISPDREFTAMSSEHSKDGTEIAVGFSSTYPLPFRNCIVLGLLMGEDGLKMSKSKKNYKEPSYIFEHEGADAMRWLFFSGQTPWTSVRFQESAIAEGQREFLIRLYNCYSFFVIYANIDKWTPDQSRDREGAVLAQTGGPSPSQGNPSLTVGAPSDASRSELDRWILSELAQCSLAVFDRLSDYDNYAAARALIAFVDALSNWYVRRSRDRFWKSGMDDDKRSAYATLHESLVTVSKLIAPFTPFIAESMYQNLVRTHDATAPLSVHLCDYPVTVSTRDEVAKNVDAALNEEIDTIRELVSCGRAARAQAKLRVRQPLDSVEIVLTDPVDATQIGGNYSSLIKEELNVKNVIFSGNPEDYVTYTIKPNFRVIGPKHGPLAPTIKAALASHSEPGSLLHDLQAHGQARILVGEQSVALTSEDIQVELSAKPGWAASQCPAGVVILKIELTPELIDEGTARDLVNQVQQVRKNLNLRYEQRIDLAIVGNENVQRVVNAFSSQIMAETLAQSLLSKPIPGVEPGKVELDDSTAEIYVKPL